MRVETVAQQLLFSTVRIETEGGPGGHGIGTGFIFAYSHPSFGGQEWLALVTNKHVVEGCTAYTFFLIAAADADGRAPRIGERLDVRVHPEGGPWWLGHPDPGVDIAVIDMARVFRILTKQGRQPFIKALRSEMLPDPEQLEDSDAVENVLVIGYPNGLYDKTNLTPFARRGITASPPALDYCGEAQVIIDAAVFPGSSGSPVFVWRPEDASYPELGLPLGAYLLGILSSGFQRTQEGWIEMVPIPTSVTPIPITPQLINLGTVYKASKILETIEHALRITGKIR